MPVQIYPVCFGCNKRGVFVGMPMCSRCMSRVPLSRLLIGILGIIVSMFFIVMLAAYFSGGPK
jgi:hypothetical protein